MSGDDSRGIQYIREVYEDSQRFALTLLKENERLRKQNAELQHELSVRTAVLNARSSQLASPDTRSMEERLRAIERENERLNTEQRILQQQSASLLNLYVAAYRLHGTLDRGEVLGALQEIIANMVGSEKLAIFELDAGGKKLSLISSMGVDPERYRNVPLGTGPIGHAARTGEIYLGGRARDGDEGERSLTACVPMTIGKRVSGVIAIFELLNQKPALDSDDLELFNLLRTHAGMALYCTRLHVECSEL
jgi:GAF domain-containing protein